MSSDSFTQRVVAELAPHVPLLACCRAALIEGMALVSDSPAALTTTRMAAARVAMHTLHSDGVAAHVARVATPRRPRYALSRVEPGRRIHESDRLCCARSRLRGAFLSAGRLQRAEAGPHLEIGCPTMRAAQRLVADAARLGVPAQIRTRRGRPLVCVRRAAAVGAFLSGIGAQTGRLDYEAGRVVRDVRSTVNRRLNAETANLRRSATASVTQLAAANELERDVARWLTLPAALREAAGLRRRHPDDDLASLAARAGCSRSAMAGRLHRLVALAAGVSVPMERSGTRGEAAWQ